MPGDGGENRGNESGRERVVTDSLGPFAAVVGQDAPGAGSGAPEGTQGSPNGDGVGDAGSAGEGKRDKALVIRLTAAELELLHASARWQGRGKTAGWARDVLVTHAAAKELRAERESPAVNAARGELVRIGNNLNQMARALNVAVKNGQVVPAREALEVLSRARRDMAATRVILRDGVTKRSNGEVS